MLIQSNPSLSSLLSSWKKLKRFIDEQHSKIDNKWSIKDKKYFKEGKTVMTPPPKIIQPNQT